MAGRPPKPTALKLLRGNPGKRPLNDREPKPTLGAEAPTYVRSDPILLAEWKRHAARLLRYGLLTEIDDEALAVLCVLSIQFRDQVAAGAAPSALAGTSRELRALWSRFGMTPADRARVKTEKPEEKSKLARFIGGA
jgi:phage terminase small subunit